MVALNSLQLSNISGWLLCARHDAKSLQTISYITSHQPKRETIHVIDGEMKA